MPSLPTQRTLAALRAAGYEVDISERYNHFSRKKNDLFGFIDLVAIRAGEILGVQATGNEHGATRMRKIEAEPRAGLWLRAGGRIEVWSWDLRGARGKRKAWTLRRLAFTSHGWEELPSDVATLEHAQETP